jgi:hypothetical protein
VRALCLLLETLEILWLLFLGFEEAQERRMLGEIVLDLGDARPGPVLEPGLGEVVLDAMEAAFAHAEMIDIGPADGHGPFGSTWRP